MTTTTTATANTVPTTSGPVWLTGRIYYRNVTTYEHTARNGKTYHMLALTLPQGTIIEGRDMTGWHVNVIASRYSLEALQARRIVPFSVKADAQLWAFNDQQRRRITGTQLVDALRSQYEAYLESKNKTLQTAQTGQINNQVEEQWHIVNALISEPEAYRLTDNAQQLLAMAARDVSLTVKLEQVCNKAAQAYLTGRYTPQAMMQATHMIVSRFAIVAEQCYETTFSQQDVWQAVVSILDVLIDPVNKAIYELLDHPAVNPYMRDEYVKDTQQWVGEHVADYMLTNRESRASYSFNPFHRKTVAEVLTIFSSYKYTTPTNLLVA